MFSKPRIISTFVSFVIIYFFPWIFYAYLAVGFFESQVITDVSRGDDILLLPLTIGCFLMLTCFHRYMKNGESVHTVFIAASISESLSASFLGQVLDLSCTDRKCESLRLDI